MNPASYSAVGSGTALLAQFLMWVTKWPLQPPTEAQADAMAALILMIVASIHAWRISISNGKLNVTPPSDGAQNAQTPPSA